MNDLPRSRTGSLITPCESEVGCKPLSCAECMKEIPADTGHSADVDDYVQHFCGLDCFQAWQKKRQQP